MTEVGLLLFPFILLLSSVFEFGWYYFHEHTLQHATREGMRLALVGGITKDGNGDSLSREDSIIHAIQKNASWAMVIRAEDIAIFKVGDNYQNPEGWETAAPNAGNPADYMRVVVDYEHTFLTPFVGRIFSENGSAKMRAQATYRNELYDIQTEA
ncbi:TadE/TadG family type IV pilus assembly protein [Nitrospira sp. M1]